jgi:hypothetical protein
MAEYRKEGSRFVVDLGSVTLPPLMEKQVETEIRGVVLKALAESDFAARARLSHSIFDRFPGRTLGLWLDPDQQVPWPVGPLDVPDHTLIVREMITYPFHVLRSLRLSKGDPAPSGREVLEAMLDVDVIDPFVKERTREMLKVLEQIEPATAKLSREQRRTISYVEKLIAGRPLTEQVRILRDPRQHPDPPDPDFIHQILEWIAQMLEHGESTIYSPDFSFHRMLRSGSSGSGQVIARERDTVDTIKDADAIGAAAGGLVGTVVPGLGTAAGAAAAGGGASIGAAVGALIDWIF